MRSSQSRHSWKHMKLIILSSEMGKYLPRGEPLYNPFLWSQGADISQAHGNYTIYNDPNYTRYEQACFHVWSWLTLSRSTTFSLNVCFRRFLGKKGKVNYTYTFATSDILPLNRLSAVTRLFRVLQDITNPASEFEGRHWRSSMTVILHFYLEPLWTDDKVCFALNFFPWNSWIIL